MSNIPHNLPTGFPLPDQNGNGNGVNKPAPKPKKSFPDIMLESLHHFKDIFSIVGIVAVIIIIALGAASVAKYATVGLKKITAAVTLSTSDIFTSEEVIPEVSVDNIVVGKPFVLSWDHMKKATGGSYSLNYPCADGLYLTADTIDAGKKTVLCNKDFDFVNRGNQMTLIASSTQFSKVELPITLKFTRNGESKPLISSVIRVDILNPSIKDEIPVVVATTTTPVVTTPAPTQPVVTTPKPTTPTPGQTTSNTYNIGGSTSSTVENPNGKADLRPVILDVGYLDSNNNFVSDSAPRRSNRVAVKFKVENIGDKTSSSYRFNAYLPTYPSQTFNSDEQIGIGAGNRIEYTIAFDKALEGNQSFRILVDGSDNVKESNENNNDDSTTIKIQ